MRKTTAVIILLLAFAAMAFAHGKEKHIMGTVTAIGDNTITVEDAAKKSITVSVSDKTKIEKSGSAAALKDLKVGDRVAISADETDGKLVASRIRSGPMKDHAGMQGMEHKPDTTHQH